MVKQVKNSSANLSWGNGYVTSAEMPDRLNGQLFGIIEALGLTEKQEESVKGLIRRVVWDTFQDAVYITPERHTAIREEYYEKHKEIYEQNVPMSAI